MNRRHMTGDHHGRTAGRATPLARAMDEILGTHTATTTSVLLPDRGRWKTSKPGLRADVTRARWIGRRASPSPAWIRPGGPLIRARRRAGPLTRKNTMGKASRRKRQQRSSSHEDRPHAAAAGVPAPNLDGTAVQAIRDALAMLTSVHASPQDLPGLAEELAADRGRQGLAAYVLVSRFITQSARELADARHNSAGRTRGHNRRP